MAHFSISITGVQSEAEALKVLRQFSAESLSVLRQKLRSQGPALSFSTSEYPLELGLHDGERHQHARIRDAVAELEKTGCSVSLSYQASASCPVEPVSKLMMENLFESELLYLQQEHD